MNRREVRIIGLSGRDELAGDAMNRRRCVLSAGDAMNRRLYDGTIARTKGSNTVINSDRLTTRVG